MKIIIKLFFAAALILVCNSKLLAQNNRKDADSLAEKTGDLTSAESHADTALKANRLEADSLPNYKSDKDFAYMKFMDSLLRKSKDLFVDTFSVGNSNIRRLKNIPQSSPEKTQPPRLNFVSAPIVKIVLWILAFFLIGFLVYKLFLGENFFKRNRTYRNISDIQKEDEDISDPSAYDTLISQAVKNKNFRLAIRYSYLQALHRLAGSGVVQFSADKTNYQYVKELQGKSYQNEFASITLNYEYVWYGKFEIDENIYNRLSGEYKTFKQKL